MMPTYQIPIIVGVFQDEAQARKAVEELHNANFGRDQLGIATHNPHIVIDHLAQDFMKLGIPQERANYYEHEFQAGHVVVSVRPDGREAEAKHILQGNGGYDRGLESARPSEEVKQ
jgi:hypothetical protein